MTFEIQTSSKLLQFPRNIYMPYGCTELTSRHIEYARKHLNETEETRAKYLRMIKRFVNEELTAFSELDDNYLLCFLRVRKFDFKKTCLLMKNIAEFFHSQRCYFNRIDTDIVRRIIESKLIGFLPYRDAKGRGILLAIGEKWNPDDLKAEDIIFGTLVALHAALENPVNQVAGYVLIIDFKNIYFRQFRETSNWLLFCVNNLQNLAPATVKEIHLIHAPTIVQMGWNVIKPFLYEGVKNLITFHDSSDMKSLHDKIPPCILPEELGGQLGPHSFEHWACDIPRIREKFFKNFLKESDEQKID